MTDRGEPVEVRGPLPRSLLAALLDHNLLTQSVPGRYRFHELTRVYARGLTHLDAADSAPDSDQA